jgi:hypothetical protein
MKRFITLFFILFIMNAASSDAHSEDTRFVDMQNGTIFDTVNNLTWLKDANCFSQQNWYDATSKTVALASGQCGLTDGTKSGDWQLPTIWDFEMLVDAADYRYGTLNAAGFSSIQAGDYWSSSTYTGSYDTYAAWYMNMVDGSMVKADMYTNQNIWPIRRGGHSWSFGSLILSVATIDYGNVLTGSISAPNHIILKNVGTATVVVSSITLTGSASSEYSVYPGGASPCSSLAPTLEVGDSCTLGVSATPTTSGAKNANLTFTTANGIQNIPITANAYSTVLDITQTGQSTCYDTAGALISCAGTGQDGEFMAGISYPNPRFVDNGNQTLTDNLTGLNWTKDTNLIAIRDPLFDADSTIGDGMVTWQHALDYIFKLNSENYLGYNDWRLPNLNELKSLINIKESNQAIWLNSQGFMSFQSYDSYWSSSTSASLKSDAWNVDMSDGNLDYGMKTDGYMTDGKHVLPVRGGQGGALTIPKTGQSTCYDALGTIITCAGTGQDGDLQRGAAWPTPRFTDNSQANSSDLTVTDNLTGLVWTKDGNAPGSYACGVGTIKTWQGALDYVKCLNSNTWLGKTDWRVPNRNELESLVNKGVSNTASWLLSQRFNNVNAGDYWSSNTFANSTSSAWYVNILDGSVDFKFKTFGNYVWPVSGGQVGLSSSLTLSISGSGAGSVVSTPTGILCDATCGASFATGTPVTLTSTPYSGSTFAGWSGACSGTGACTVTMDSTKNVGAVFTLTLPDTTKPVVTSLSIPPTGTTLTVAVSSLTATDNIGVIGYCLTETNSAAGCIWYSPAQTSYTFAGIPDGIATAKTLYAWANDLAGNISNSYAAATTITLPDVTKPVVTAFTIPAAPTTLTVAVSSLTATDNAAVTGYLITESSTVPLVSAAGWSATKPTNYIFTGIADGIATAKTLYAWAKDASGNISNGFTATTIVTLLDATKPVVSAFTISATTTTMIVAVSNLTATDNIAVTGYLLTESATIPAVSATGWSTTKPTSYTFTGIPDGIATTKTLYAWTKDAAGNVSSIFSASTIITLPDTTQPVVTSLTIPATGTTVAVAVSSLTATDNIGVIGYCLTETNSAAGCIWYSPAQTSYTFAGIPDGIATTKTLYAWANDLAGNVSNSYAAATTITLPDVTNPVITAFSIPTSSNSLNVSITLTATDNSGTIASYCLIETNSSAGCIWTAQKPTTYSFNAAGSNTIYAFVKDATGNVSTSATDTVTITLPDTTAPIVTAFTIPVTSDSLTVTITTFTATDNTTVTAYLLSESGSQPQSNDPGWSATQPTQYVFTSQGTKTLYAFAKDTFGNISVPLSAPVTITLADTTAPVVTSFTIPATGVSLTVPVTALVAEDAVSVAGYLLKGSATVPQGNDPNWTAIVPTQYVFSSQGVKTLYAFAKDAAGNISAPLSATVAITLPDTTAPSVSQFTIPTTATSLTVPIISLVAADAVGVTGYLLKESFVVPQGNDPDWTANLPTQYVFTSQGAKALYAFAKDAAGNISAPLFANVTITLADTTAPVVTAFTIPETATNLTVPVSSFSATDAVGVNGYYLSETSTAPLLNDSHWTTTPTSSFTFAAAGSKTLYAFAKDAAGNISVPVSGTVTITLPDTTAPTVTVFTMPTTATSLTVPVTTFVANDNTAVTGYILTETATALQANIPGWTSMAPSSYTFGAAGSLTLYAFAKDAAGNVSVPVTATIAIALPDTATPTVTVFIIPATSSSLTVPVTTFTATDNIAVTGYLLSEGSATPSPTAQNWASTSQGSYTFSTVGNKTLYAFAKDAAGNISPPASSSVVITLPAIAGVCGSSSGQVLSAIPTTNLCNTGTATTVTGTGPWNWSCNGTNSGADANCNTSIQTWAITATAIGGNGTVTCTSPVSNGENSTCTVSPASGYQLATFTDNSIDKIGTVAGGGYSIANVIANHSVVATFSQIPPTPVNGACGTSSGGTFAIAPTANFCTTGTATAVTGTGPWNWKCTDSNGGTTATCNASIQTWTITATVTGINGSVSCTSPVNSGATSTCTVTPASGYQLAAFTDNSIDKTGSVAGGSYSIANVTAGHTIAATFSLIPPTPVNGACGSSNNGTFAVVPTTNFCTTGTATYVTGTGPWSWTCAGNNGGTKANCSASIQTYTVNANVTGGNGTVSCISPVNIGATSTCTVTPASGYQLATFTDNSIDKTGTVAGASYSIANVTANHSAVASFSQIPPTPVNGACGTSNGGIFTIAPATNFCTTGTATTVTGAGPWGWTCTGTNSGTTAACNASIQNYTITATATGGNGTVTCTSPINSGATSTCTVSPASGYQLATFTDNSVDKIGSVAGGGYSIANVIANHSVAATFSLMPPAPVNGTCGTSNSGTFTIIPTTNLCNSGTATATTGTGPWYWSCSGTNGGTAATCAASIATSTPTQLTVTPTPGTGFTITPATPQTVTNNSTTSFTVIPSSGYGVASVSGCSGSLSGNTYTTGAITANCTVSVTAVARNATSGSGSTSPPTIADALKVLQAAVGITPLTAAEQIRYDVAPLGSSGTPVGNGVLDAADVILILRRSIGIGIW